MSSTGQRTNGVGAFHLPRPRPTGVLAMVVAAALISWLAIANHNAPPAISRVAPVPITYHAPAPVTTPNASGAIVPVALTAAQLKEAAISLGQPIFWAGPVPGVRYELSHAKGGAVLVRYLPSGVRAGQPGQFLTIGTGSFPNAFSTAQSAVHQPGILSQQLADGGLAFYQSEKPNLVTLVFPKLDYRVLVFDPSATQARAVAVSGQVQPVR